ncbi:MAG TPA: CDP-alcohol phosphatidyltransferase family protein [Tepidiformaceae bacterium]|nr:CDP-alcohol phosphatidyltransferase family protein [Tepidiformaceae bacterium]HMO95896.1 CDP-alcohol phosphatidyltransferase family protein [Tepidiformaceae bacterium]
MPINLMPQRLPQNIQDGIGKTVGGMGITPNMISLFGFAGNALAAWLITENELVWAGLVYLFCSALDLVDGAVARAMGLASPFGGVFDAVLDRSSEAIVLAACAWYFAERGEDWQVAAAFAALFGSIAVSYMRARAEVVGLSMRDGLFRRQERVALLGLGLLFNGLTVVVAALAVLSNLTALQRFWKLRQGIRD